MNIEVWKKDQHAHRDSTSEAIYTKGAKVFTQKFGGRESLAQSLEKDQPAGEVLQKTNVPISIRNGIGKRIVWRYPYL